MNIFVAFFVLLLLLAESTPPAASSIPLIGQYTPRPPSRRVIFSPHRNHIRNKVRVAGAYYCLNMILITLSTFLSVIVINLYFRGDKRNKLPDCLRAVSTARNHTLHLHVHAYMYLHVLCM